MYTVITQNIGCTDETNAVSILEFYNGEKKLKDASDFLLNLLQSKMSQTELKAFYDSCSIVERKFKTERGSIAYSTQFLDMIYDTDITEEQYISEAFKIFNQLILIDDNLEKNLMKVGKFQSTEQLFEVLTNLFRFDYYCAKAVIQFYTKEEIVLLHARAKESLQEKLRLTSELIIGSDGLVICCLQEVTRSFCDMLQSHIGSDFVVKMNVDETTAIVHSSNIITEQIEFPEDATELRKEILVLKTIDDVIIISGHFSSKKKADVKDGILKNHNDQLVTFNTFLSSLKTKGYAKIISGCDYNCQTTISPDGVTEFVQFDGEIPSGPISTCKKERTALQTQFKKINKLDCGSKDKISVSGLTIVSGCVTIMDGTLTDLPCLPTSSHPFDHYTIKCMISV